jgi:hypothetical protein
MVGRAGRRVGPVVPIETRYDQGRLLARPARALYRLRTGKAVTMFKLIPTVRGGAVNSVITSKKYATVEEARDATKALTHENARVTRVMIVDVANGSKFVEWIERT